MRACRPRVLQRAALVVLAALAWSHVAAFAAGPGAVDAAPPGFSTTLPLLVIAPESRDRDGFITRARLSVFDTPGGPNAPDQQPTVILRVVLRPGPGSRPDGKAHYAVELAEGRALALAGLPACREWLLHGSVRDKAMLRNGMAYEFGRILFPGVAPATRFCEVLLDDGRELRYLGVHILAESLRRVGRDLAARQGAAVFLHRGDGREDGGGQRIRVGDTEFGITAVDAAGNIARELPQPERVRIESDLLELERAIYSVRPATFLKYQELLDERSAIDLFILNNLMLNTIEYMAPCTIYRNREGKFEFLPEWRFDHAYDNRPARRLPLPFESGMEKIAPPSVLARKVPVWRILERGGDIRDLRMYPVYLALNGQHYLWFDHLFLSSSFIDGLYARYHELKRTRLTPGFLGSLADRLALDLGGALARDWRRWHDAYTAEDGPGAVTPFVDARGEVKIRQTASPAQELVKINHLLARQDAFILDRLETLDWMTADLYDRSTSGTRQAAYACVTLVGMFILTHLLTRRL